MKKELQVSQEDEGLRLDLFLTKQLNDYSRSYFQELIVKSAVLVNGLIAKKREKLKLGDLVALELIEEKLSNEAEDIPLDILYEDAEIIAINKKTPMVVHPAPGHPKGTFVNALLFHCKLEQALIDEEETNLRPGIVHRLDKDTSGVLVAAKTRHALQHLSKSFAERKVKKLYYAVCIGNPGKGFINSPIARHPSRRKEFSTSEKGKAASTFYETVHYCKQRNLSFVQLEPITGRTHQLRVHLKALGHPILGCELYGQEKLNKKYDTKRQFLHAAKLSFPHPLSEEMMEIEAPLPEEFSAFLAK